MACLVHAGIAIIALGVSFSGPYKQEVETELGLNGSAQVGPYRVTLTNLYEGRGANFAFLEAELQIFKDNTPVFILSPQRRQYDKFQRSSFSEAATYPSLGHELYVTLLGVNGNKAVLRMSSNPLVNWLWIGGTIISLAPLLALRRRKSSPAEVDI